MDSKNTKALPLFAGEEPGPVEFVVDGLILDGQLNGLFGDGGLGKSYLALHLAYCVATGRPFFGRKVSQRNVLYIDVENLGHNETLRRSFQLARGHGGDPGDVEVHYYSPEAALSSKQTTDEVREIIDGLGVGFIILDSLTLGAVGTNASDQVEVVELLKKVHGWGVPVLTLDHITKSARSDQANSQAFGSVMKRNAARSLIRLHKSGETLCLTHDKINCAPPSDPIHYRMDFEEGSDGRVTVTFAGAEPPPEVEAAKLFDASYESYQKAHPKPPTALDEVWYAVNDHYSASSEPATPNIVSEATEIDKATVNTYLSRLANDGELRRVGRGEYVPSYADLTH